jgi:hypothetical protein
VGNFFRDHGWSTGGTIASSTVLGYATDRENDKLYYFLQGKVTGGDNLNSIIEYDPISNSFAKVIWEDSALEYEEDRRIKDAKIVDGWIYYNGFSYGLKKVNVSFAKNYTTYDIWTTGTNYSDDDYVRVGDGRIYQANTDLTPSSEDPRDSSDWDESLTLFSYPADSSGNMDSENLSLINIPPSNIVQHEYKSDTDRIVNNIRKRLFQFTYRYKYRNHGYSRTAPISDIALPLDDETPDGEITNNITFNNYIELTITNGDGGIVEFAELFLREGNDGSWKYVDKIDVGTETYDFYNDKVYEVASDTVVNTIADSVPRESEAMEYISENTLLLGGNTEGFDNIDLDVTLTPEYEEITLLTPGDAIESFSDAPGRS